MALPTLDLCTTDIHSGSASNPTYSFNHTISGATRFLYVQVTYSTGVGASTSGVTYNGVAMTFLAKKQQFNNGAGSEACVEVYYMKAPPSGTNSVQITFTGGTIFDAKNAAVSWNNADQSSPVDGGTTSFQTGAHSTYSASMTTANANEVVIMAYDHIFMPNTDASNQTVLWNSNAGGNHLGAGSYQNATSVGTYSDQYSINSTSANLQAEVSIMFGIKPFIDTTPPSVPTGVVAVRTAPQVVLTWNASSDDVGVTGYKVYRNGVLYQTLGNVLTYTDSSISSSTSYTYNITAFDAAGNESGQSAGVVAGILYNQKSFLFKVYNSAGTTLLKTWTDVVTDPTFDQEINGAGSQMRVTLKRDPTNFGENSDISYNNQVQVYAFDLENVNGIRIFIGKIVDYIPDYNNNALDVILMGYGVELDQFMYEQSQTVTTYSNIQFVQGVTASWSNQTTFSVSITPTSGNALLLALILPNTVSGEGVQAVGDTQGNTWTQDNATAWRTSYKNGYAFQRWATNVAGGSTTVSGFFVNSGATPVVGHQTTGFLHILEYSGITTQAGGSALDPDAQIAASGGGVVTASTGPNGQIVSSLNGDLLWAVGGDGTNLPTGASSGMSDRSTYSAGGDNSVSSDRITGATGLQTATMSNFSGVNVPFLMAVALKPNSTTITAEVVTFAYTNTDPGTMFRAVMDNYIAQGGTLTYTVGTVGLTGSLVTATFKNYSIFQSLEFCRALSPAGWYWYIDQANNVVYFKQKSSTADLTFAVGKDVQSMVLEHRAEAVVNKVFITGGQQNGGANLYIKVSNTGSISTYGPWMNRYNNSNVTTSGTAYLIGKAILDAFASPEVRTTVDIADSNGNALGYDIESIAVNGLGKTISFRNTGNTATDNLVIQLTRFSYSPDSLKLTLSTVPPDVNKKLERIARDLDAVAEQNNTTYAVPF